MCLVCLRSPSHSSVVAPCGANGRGGSLHFRRIALPIVNEKAFQLACQADTTHACIMAPGANQTGSHPCSWDRSYLYLCSAYLSLRSGTRIYDPDMGESFPLGASVAWLTERGLSPGGFVAARFRAQTFLHRLVNAENAFPVSPPCFSPSHDLQCNRG